jgi:hypothetical protein
VRPVHRFPDGRVLYKVAAGEKRRDCIASWGIVAAIQHIVNECERTHTRNVRSDDHSFWHTAGFMLMWRELEPSHNEWGEVAP